MWTISQRRAREILQENRQLFIDVLSILSGNGKLTEQEMDLLYREHEQVIAKLYEVIE